MENIFRHKTNIIREKKKWNVSLIHTKSEVYVQIHINKWHVSQIFFFFFPSSALQGPPSKSMLFPGQDSKLQGSNKWPIRSQIETSFNKRSILDLARRIWYNPLNFWKT